MPAPKKPDPGTLRRRRIVLLIAAVSTIAAGLALRELPLGLPASVVKWGGSILWAAMVYQLLAATLPRRRPLIIAITAAIFSTSVELSRLYHSQGLDAFRLTPAGILLLGRIFDPRHFAVYWGTIGLAALADLAISNRLSPQAEQF